MYLGGGRQWDPQDLDILREQRRPAYEFNEVMPSVNSAIGYQIANRMDILFRPRGGDSDQAKADIRSKIIMQIADSQRLHWRETEVFTDGIIQQRGYYDVRVSFDDNMMGHITIDVPDPMDVVPDPDAKTYDPSGWSDVMLTRWLTLDEIEQSYGTAASDAVERLRNMRPEDADWGEADDTGVDRSKFGDPNFAGAAFDVRFLDGKINRVRVIDRQLWVRQMTRCLYYPRSGDVKIAENLTPEVLQAQIGQGAVATKMLRRRVRWQVATADVELHNEWSPYDDLTIVPYFAYFRRGQTLGMVDNAIGPQQARNKALSQYVHIINTTANSGWIVRENSLTNMSTEELAQQGAKTGLVIEVKEGATGPEKIAPNPVPQGVDRLVQVTSEALKSVTIPEAMRGITGPEKSGVAIQHKQFAAQQQMAMPLDNLARTRHMLAHKLHKLVQQFYTEERVYRITEQDPATGKPQTEEIVVNQYDPETGGYVNDLTEGDYDVVVSEQPMQVTFENSQFQQALELRQAGVSIPDSIMVQHSTLSRKAEIVEMMSQQSQTDPLLEQKAALLREQVRKTAAEAVNKAVEAMFSATQAGNQIAALPGIAPLADQLLKSAGFTDADQPPIVPAPAIEEPVAPPDPNTNPLTPVNPAVGMREGIERMDAQVGLPQ
jgi:hypothetical protein